MCCDVTQVQREGGRSQLRRSDVGAGDGLAALRGPFPGPVHVAGRSGNRLGVTRLWEFKEFVGV